MLEENVGQSHRVYDWEILWDRCAKKPGGGPWDRWVPEDEIITLKQGKRLLAAAARLYGLPMPKIRSSRRGVLGPYKAYYEHPDMVIYLPVVLDAETSLHEFGHYMVDQSADFNPEFIPDHGPLFARYLCDLGVAFDFGEQYYLQKLGEACGVKFAMPRDAFRPISRERGAGLDILEMM